MASVLPAFLVSLVLLTVFIHIAGASFVADQDRSPVVAPDKRKRDTIFCYECNSATDSKCLQDNLPDTLLVDCNDFSNNKTQRNKNYTYTFCRKIVQILDLNPQPDSRVIRGCGWYNSSYNGTCYQHSRGKIYQHVCGCYGDKCNGASSLLVSLGVLLFGATALLIHSAVFARPISTGM